MRVRLCGVRGSTPAPGADFVGVGGNTSCVAVTPDDTAGPRLVLDAGTGIRSVTELLQGEPFDGTILLSHLHWDHVQGLPFFGAGDRDDASVAVLMPDNDEPTIRSLERLISPPAFPISLAGLRGRWSFDAIVDGDHEVEGVPVRVRSVPHKGGRTLGFRLTGATGTFAYVPDHCLAANSADSAALRELIADVDVLVHNAQFTAAETELAAAYGHSTIDQAVEAAARLGVRRLLLFHHAPDRTDAQLEALLDSAHSADVGVELAREGLEFDI